MQSYDVLIVEDDLALREALFETLALEGYRVLTAANGTDALQQLAKQTVKLVVSDVQMPVMDGLQLMQNMQLQQLNIPVILMTAYGTVPKAVAAVQMGAVDYLIKPFAADVLAQKVAVFMQNIDTALDSQVVCDPIMQDLYALITKVAKTDVTVLLQGESGTGKEVVARFIHQHSTYQQGPFVAINCAAIPEHMLEAMLFGYEKGAFTGATQSVPGKFEIAQGGTLLLDEVSEMPLALQAKLLRVLQEKEVERLGSHQKIRLQVRVLATTNRNLKAQVSQGHFREDLYYRLSVFPLKIPPLRDRIGDILPLAKDFIRRHCPKELLLTQLPVLAPAALEKLRAYAWPGNVRELENVLQRALVIHEQGHITPMDLVFDGDTEAYSATQQVAEPQPVASNSPAIPDKLDDGVRLAEAQMILQTLQTQKGSRKLTAQTLGVSDRTLRYKIARMKESGIVIPC